MSKKPDSRLKVYVVERHTNLSGTPYVESCIMAIESDKRVAKELVDRLNDEVALDDEDSSYVPDYVSHTMTKYYVGGINS